MIRIQVFKRDELVGDETSNDLSCFVGKDTGSVILLHGWRVGRRQIEFTFNDQGLFLKDNGGMAPVKVNGNAVLEYGPIASNDTIELADYKLRAHPTREAHEKIAAQRQALRPAPVVTALKVSPVPENSNPLENAEGIAMRAQLHRKLIAAMDLRRVNVSRMADTELRASVQKLIEEIIDNDTTFEAMRPVRDALRDVVLNEVVGLGPLESLLADDAVTEIMVNRHNDIFVEREGRLTRSDISFSNDAAVLAAIERIVSPLGRRIDESSPMVDARSTRA
jgi:pilus assembly protein CpaF